MPTVWTFEKVGAEIHRQPPVCLSYAVPLTEYHPQFFTATILEWKHLLKPNKYKAIIVDSLRFLVKEKRVIVYAFVIMPNHLHLIWQIQGGHKREAVQRDFLKYTAQQIKLDLVKNHPSVLPHFEVAAKDRTYQFWERNPLTVDLYNHKTFLQKLEYIHANPVQERWGLAPQPEAYQYTSARFYETGIDDWGFLIHYAD
jgi:putative transposase